MWDQAVVNGRPAPIAVAVLALIVSVGVMLLGGDGASIPLAMVTGIVLRLG